MPAQIALIHTQTTSAIRASHNEWPVITEAQRQQDQQLRLEQAVARRLADASRKQCSERPGVTLLHQGKE